LAVAIVVDAHHESAAKAHEGYNRLEPAAVGPEIHDTNLGLRRSVGSFDGGFKGDSFLDEVEVAVGGGDALEVFVGWGELNSFACKGVEGFEQEVFALRRKAFEVALGVPVVEEDGFGDGGMVEVWERKFADAEVPVRMAGPLDIERIAVVEGELDIFTLELVDDRSIVDAMNGDLPAIALIEEAVALLAEFGDVYRGDVELVFVDVEIGQRFLVSGIDFEEDYVFGIVVADDDVAQDVPVGFFGYVA
jgi:hypothetical protein